MRSYVKHRRRTLKGLCLAGKRSTRGSGSVPCVIVNGACVLCACVVYVTTSTAINNHTPTQTCLVNRGGQIVQLGVDPAESDALFGLQGLAQELEGDGHLGAGGAEGAVVVVVGEGSVVLSVSEL